MVFIAFKKRKMRSAIESNDLPRIRQLLDDGVDPDMQDDYGRSFLYCAIEQGNSDAVAILLEKGAKVVSERHYGYSLLHAAARKGGVEIAEMLIEKNPALLSIKDSKGNTPLHIAAREGHADMAALLIARGANPEEKNHDNRTSLFIAQYERHEEVMKILKPYRREPDFSQAQAALEKRVMTAASSPTEENWKKLSGDKIAHVTHERAIGYKLTEIFNFKTRERTQLYQNLETRAETSDTKRFDDLSERAPLEEALRELEKKGGRGSLGPMHKKKFGPS